MITTYETEFPDFSRLDVTIPIGFQDVSWHNDVMPAFEKKISNGSILRIWINYADREARETGKEDPRFALALHDCDSMFIQMLIETDIWEELLGAIEVASK